MGTCPNMWGRVWHHADHLAIWVVPARGFVAVFRQFCVDALWTHCMRSVTSCVWTLHHLGGAVTSCVMSWHCMCTGHMTFCYKRSADTLFEALLALRSWPLVRLFIRFTHCSSGSPLLPTCGWCLKCVGRDVSSMSPG